MKEARTELDRAARAKEDLINEYDRLTSIHAQGKIWGVQEAPTRIVSITGTGVSPVRFMGRLYNGGDYYGYLTTQLQQQPILSPLQMEERLIQGHQLLYALKHLDDLGLRNGDIKP